jgi:hypothetical protein
MAEVMTFLVKENKVVDSVLAAVYTADFMMYV